MFEEIKKRLQSTESWVSLILGVAVVAVVGTVIINAIRSRPATTPPKPEEKKAEKAMQPISQATTHTVAKGDTLWGISKQYYKTGYNWPDVAKTNQLASSDRIAVGQTLIIPLVTPIFPPGQVGTGMMNKKPEVKSYTVVRGDSLWKIATAQYNNGFRWVDIAKANNLTNPNLIHAGNVLTLP